MIAKVLNKYSFRLWVLLVKVLLCTNAFAQEDSIADNNIGKIIEQIKVSYELEKLNDCRIKLRAINFSSLKTKEEKEQYAYAYKQLALAHRNHRYIRPAFDLYQKYISLRDTILAEEKNKLIRELQNKHKTMHADITKQIDAAGKEKSSLVSDKASLDSLKKNNLKYSALFAILITAAFIFVTLRYNKKLMEATELLRTNRKQIFSMNDAVTRGTMTMASLNRIQQLNDGILTEASNVSEVVERDLKSLKEIEQPLRSLKEYVLQVKQLAEIATKNINDIFKKINSA